MNKPHFFKAKSRIGLPHPPSGHNILNTGVEEAPEAILSSQFLANFDHPQVNEFIFSKPEEVEERQYWQVLAKELTEFKNLINKQLRPNQTQVVIGGENSVTLASVLAVLERLDDIKSFGYIQFDSHGEMNSYSGSQSKNFHGMYMRALLDSFDISEIEQIAQPKLSTNQVMTIGDLTLDGDEPEFYRKKKISNIDRAELKTQNSKVKSEIRQYVERHQHLHINFDVDIFDQSIAPATGLAEDGRWNWEEVMTIIETIKQHSRQLSIDCCEINPLKKGAQKTITVARKVLYYLLN